MQIIKTLRSKDGTSHKYLQKTDDGQLIETGYYQINEENVICVSTQTGCKMNCKFCSTSDNLNNDSVRNLSSTELLDQCRNVITT